MSGQDGQIAVMEKGDLLLTSVLAEFDFWENTKCICISDYLSELKCHKVLKSIYEENNYRYIT